jgi:hypothetical protein
LNAAHHIYSYSGGNMPQYLLNLFAEEIAGGRMRAALLCGGEALRTQHGLDRSGAGNRWIGFPYPRLMNANAFIDQAAALVFSRHCGMLPPL